jgi:hypothetical protein
MTSFKSVFAAVLATLATSAASAQPQPQPAEPNGQTQAVAAAAVSASGAAASAAAAQDSGDGFVDKAKNWAEEHQLAERLSGDVDGWYPRLGGMTRGSGFALGPGYRLHLGTVRVDASTALSTKMYKAVDLNVRWIQLYDDRLELWTDYRFEDFPQEDFWGLGAASPEDGRTSYDFDSHDVSLLGLVRPVPWFRAGANLALKWPSIGPGRDERYPSTEQLFSDVEAPGLVSQPTYLHLSLIHI